MTTYFVLPSRRFTAERFSPKAVIMREIRADATLEVRPTAKASIAFRDIENAFSLGAPRAAACGPLTSP